MDKFKDISEAGYIGEGIGQSSVSTDLKRKCLVVKQNLPVLFFECLDR